MKAEENVEGKNKNLMKRKTGFPARERETEVLISGICTTPGEAIYPRSKQNTVNSNGFVVIRPMWMRSV